MKPVISSIGSLLLFLIATLSMTSCLEDECVATTTYLRWDPVIVSAQDFRIAPEMSSSRTLEKPGKIYYYQNYLFVNDLQKGVHIFDNSDKTSPVSIGFLEIPGNVDIAIKDGFLFADNYADLVVIDLNNVNEPKLVNRQYDVFPLYGQDQNGDYIVSYIASDETVEIPCEDPASNEPWFWNGNVFFEDNTLSNGSGSPQAVPTGIAGSMAAFSVVGDYLYVVEENSLKVFGIHVPSQIDFLQTNHFSWGIETIFPYGSNLFIGTQNGMHIFNNSNPAAPVWIAAFAHATACDPVFVDGDIAYVTLRDGQECETFTNQLDVVDIGDLHNPELMRSYPMDNPHGLAIRDDVLFLCEGESGLKIFDVRDPMTIDRNQIEHLRGFQAYDVISLDDDHLLLVGEDGLYQFDPSDPRNVKTLSVIEVNR
jgi:hypothetical protein